MPLPVSKPEPKGLPRSPGPKYRALNLSSVGLSIPIAVLIGIWIGGSIGGLFGARFGGQLVGLGFGVVSGFYNVWKVVERLNRIEDEKDARAASPEGAAAREVSEPVE